MISSKQIFFLKDALTASPIYPNINNLMSLGTSVDTYFIATSEDNKFQMCGGMLTPHMKNWLSSYTTHNRENLYLTAISNLWKKIDYLQLSNQFDQDFIHEDEYIKELEMCESRYVITPNESFSFEDFHVAIEIANKITQRTFDEHEVAEMFSIPTEIIDNLVIQYDHVVSHNLLGK